MSLAEFDKRTAARVVRIAACALVAAAGAAFAQVPDAKTGKAPVKPAGPAMAAASPTGDSGLKARVESLEEQLVDMQVVVGTLESLAKSGGGAASQSYSRPAAGGGADASRVDSLEGQVRSLSTQVQQLSDQVRSMGGTPRRSEAPLGGSPGVAGGFGSTTVTPNNDAIGGLIGSDAAPTPPPAYGAPAPSTSAYSNAPPSSSAGGLGATPSPVATAALPPAGDTDPKQLYETAYGYLLQRDYGAAEVAFDEFLKKYPSDSLSGNAQYWLGESHFVRGQYKSAAGAFLKGYQTYAQSPKAPDSLLKLAMSLDRLGQKDAACSSYSELNMKFPNAPQSVKARAQSERQRVGCP